MCLTCALDQATDDYVPLARGPLSENADVTPARFLAMQNSNFGANVSLKQWLPLTRPELAKARLTLDED